MKRSEFMDYISVPLTYEQMHLLYRANNIKYEKCELFHDFIKSINKLIHNTYLGSEFIKTENEIHQHFDWCINKVFDDFKEENIIFEDKKQIKDYFYFFYVELFYNGKGGEDMLIKLNRLPDFSFNYHKLKSRSDIDVLIELYKVLDKSLTKKVKK